ncbi:MAG: hypothetical protein H6735_01390 [Alphaproteobacteria bacterium]|nr:hypothetical protein [Alphaproteobacteria bacterium]
MSPQSTSDSLNHRAPVQTRQVARSFFGMLTNEGFTHHQIVDLANDLLAMVQQDMRDGAPSDKR